MDTVTSLLSDCKYSIWDTLGISPNLFGLYHKDWVNSYSIMWGQLRYNFFRITQIKEWNSPTSGLLDGCFQDMIMNPRKGECWGFDLLIKHKTQALIDSSPSCCYSHWCWPCDRLVWLSFPFCAFPPRCPSHHASLIACGGVLSFSLLVLRFLRWLHIPVSPILWVTRTPCLLSTASPAPGPWYSSIVLMSHARWFQWYWKATHPIGEPFQKIQPKFPPCLIPPHCFCPQEPMSFLAAAAKGQRQDSLCPGDRLTSMPRYRGTTSPGWM